MDSDREIVWNADDKIDTGHRKIRADYLKLCGLDPDRIYRVKIDVRSMTGMIWEFKIANGGCYFKGNDAAKRKPFKHRLRSLCLHDCIAIAQTKWI